MYLNWLNVFKPPRQSAQAARTVARATGFSSSFLPAGRMQHCWHVHDARDGRVLLSQSWIDNAAVTCLSFSNLVVYDPLLRRPRAQYPTVLPYFIRVGTRYFRHLSTLSARLSFLIM